MAIEKFDSIAKAWSEGLERDGVVLPVNYGHKIADVLFTATTKFLAAFKKKEAPSAFIFEEVNGNFIMGAVVEYHAGKNDKDPGNWSYIWTFDPADIPDTAERFYLTDPKVKPSYTDYSLHKYRYSVFEDQFVPVYLFMAKMISKWLEDNVVENDIVGVELEGVFQARVAVEDGSVVKSIEPAGEIKVLIKDDASIEK